MGIKKGEWALIIFNLAYIIGFTIYYLSLKNYEFMVYIGVLVVLFIIVLAIQRKVKFDYPLLWMLSIWGLLHMLGGGIKLASGTVLYRWVPFILYQGSDPEFIILKFDQILHFYIYFVMTMVVAHLLFKITSTKVKASYLYFFAVLGSMGLSVVNEIIEFGAVIFLGKTGVGGYYNTLLDLCFNTLGAIVGGFVDYIRRR